MQHIRRICKHCHKEYTYCTYGNGPEYGTEAGCSMTYCAECQKAIDDALNKIPVKFEPKYLEINEPRLLLLFEKIRIDYLNKHENDSLPRIVPVLPDSGEYDIIEMYTHKGKTYLVEWNTDTPNEKHISVRMMYDVIKNEFTNNFWMNDDNTPTNAYYRRTSFIKRFKNEPLSPVKPMAPPIGVLHYMEPEWEIELPKFEPKIPKHELRSYSNYSDGYRIKSLVKNGRNSDCETRVADGIDVNLLIDFVDYEYTCVKYDDENFETITKIICV